MSHPFSKPPSGTHKSPTSFRISIPDARLEELQAMIKLSKIAAPTYETIQKDRWYGVTREWLLNAKEEWLRYNWREKEARINGFPHFTILVDVRDREYSIHFVSLFSERVDAVPLLLLHGWPGSFLEFLPILGLLQKKYTPQTLPYHVIVPSLPGYGFSSGLPLDRDFTLLDVAHILDSFMGELGFGSGYIVQGGDVGSKVARILATEYESCKAVHLNFCLMAEPCGLENELLPVSPSERKGLERGAEFEKLGRAYALEHATRPSTISLVLGSNPIALLAWIGEKFLEWSDSDPPVDVILESVMLYWFTETLPTSLYTYRARFSAQNDGSHGDPRWYISKPFGYSWFPQEIAPVPRSWAATSGNLVFFRAHSQGGHFAAIEQPAELLDDIEQFVDQTRSRIS